MIDVFLPLARMALSIDWSVFREAPKPPSFAVPVAQRSTTSLQLPTTSETVYELKRRLTKELYRMELDLMGGGRIAGKPCDCLSGKHHYGLEATAEELIPMDNNPVYGQIINWLKAHEAEFEPSAILQHEPEHYQGLAREVRGFRKEVLGTEGIPEDTTRERLMEAAGKARAGDREGARQLIKELIAS